MGGYTGDTLDQGESTRMRARHTPTHACTLCCAPHATFSKTGERHIQRKTV